MATTKKKYRKPVKLKLDKTEISLKIEERIAEIRQMRQLNRVYCDFDYVERQKVFEKAEFLRQEQEFLEEILLEIE